MMRNFINIINESQKLYEFAELNRIEKVFKDEFWHCLETRPNLQIWEHRDDPSIGRYYVHLYPPGEIQYIEYRHPLSSVFNRTFETTGSFIKHIAETTDEDISDEQWAAGAAKLRGIADQLRKSRDEDDNG